MNISQSMNYFDGLTEELETNDMSDNVYICQKCGPLDDFLVEGTISVSKTEHVIDYLDCELRCPICGEEILASGWSLTEEE